MDGNAVALSERHHILDGLGESIGLGISTRQVITCPHQGDWRVFVFVKPDVLQQRQKVAIPPPVGETGAASDGHISLIAYGSQRHFGRCAIITLLRQSISKRRYKRKELQNFPNTFPMLTPVGLQIPTGRSLSKVSRYLAHNRNFMYHHIGMMLRDLICFALRAFQGPCFMESFNNPWHHTRWNVQAIHKVPSLQTEHHESVSLQRCFGQLWLWNLEWRTRTKVLRSRERSLRQPVTSWCFGSGALYITIHLSVEIGTFAWFFKKDK